MTTAVSTRSTTLGSWVKALRRCLDAAGVDSTALIAQAGLTLQDIDGPDARCPAVSMRRLWQLAVQTTGDPAFGLRAASHITQTSCHALSYSMSASATLKEAFERLVRYCHVVSDAVEYGFTRQGQEYFLDIEPYHRELPPVHEATDMLVAASLRMCRSLLGHNYSPLRIELIRPAPEDPEVFARFLRAPTQFGATRNRIVFDRASMECPLDGGNPELARHNDRIVQQLLARIDRGNVRARVQSVLLQRLEHGEPSQEDVAEVLNMSSRTLQRKLGESGTTYMEILDATRRELALAYLSVPRHSVSEVTFLVGFSSNSSFTRAFRRWTGLSPSDWRAQALERLDQVA